DDVWRARTGNCGPVHLAAGVGLLVALAVLAQSGFVRLLGPVLAYEMLRTARRGRFILMRWLYAVGLLLLLLWVYSIWRFEIRFRSGTTEDYKALAQLALEYFRAFSITQFCVVALLTPAYVAGAIAEEKERKTLEFLLATDLRNREIVFGKLVARIGYLLLSGVSAFVTFLLGQYGVLGA